MTTMSDLYANIALESLFDSAGECKCEALHTWHCPDCSIEVIARARYLCEPDRSPLMCSRAAEYVTECKNIGAFCDCGRPTSLCWTLIPI